jgi:hypothetical protein
MDLHMLKMVQIPTAQQQRKDKLSITLSLDLGPVAFQLPTD